MISTEQKNPLIELGRNGFFPLFHPNWIKDACKETFKKNSKTDQKKANEIMRRLAQHKNLDRKRTLLISLSDSDRKIFIKEFFNLVEKSILKERSIFQ